MVLWSVSVSGFVCQLEEVPAVQSFLFLHMFERGSKWIGREYLASSFVTFSLFPQFILYLTSTLLFSRCCWCYMSLLQKGWWKVVFFFRSPVFIVQHYLFFCCLRSPNSSLLLSLWCQSIVLSLSLLGNCSIIIISQVRFRHKQADIKWTLTAW